VLHSNTVILLELIRGGLWGTEVSLSNCEDIDYSSVMQLAEEQSVVGLVTAGLERVEDVKIPQQWSLQFIGSTLQLEQRNKAMNAFVASLISKMLAADIYTLLVKGQGIAQCYEKPLWRVCGDVDLFLSEDNYAKAKEMLVPMTSSVEKEYEREKHLGMNIDGWVVELHGRLYCGLSSRIERELDDIYSDTFSGGNVRSWNNNGVQVFQLGIENDVFYVFTHILQHFYKEGVGLRQICDWCRLMWTNRDKIDVQKLKSRLKRAGIMSEWKAFYALASKYLGMPDLVNGFGIMVHDSRYDKKADKIMEFILKAGNMGHNRGSGFRDNGSWLGRLYVVRKAFSMFRRIGDLINHARIFPMDSLHFFPRIMWNGVRSAVKGE
jgi:hypothetical protein